MSDQKQGTLEMFLYEQAHRRPVGPRCPECHRAAPDSFCIVHGDVTPTYERFEKPFHMEAGIDKYKRAKRADFQLAILDIIKELEKEYGTAKKSEITERARSEGISEAEAAGAIEKLRMDGHIYDPKRDESYKIV